MLFPLLWRYVEGCNLSGRRPVRLQSGSDRTVPPKNGLYAQCSYLIRNPTIGAYVRYAYSRLHSNRANGELFCRALSADLYLWTPKDAPEDLMTKFVDCLVQLPNLRTLEIFAMSHAHSIMSVLRRNCGRFPSIRELQVGQVLAEFIWRCPNVECVTVAGGSPRDVEILCSHGKELKRLKRVARVCKEHVQQREPRDIF